MRWLGVLAAIAVVAALVLGVSTRRRQQDAELWAEATDTKVAR